MALTLAQKVEIRERRAAGESWESLAAAFRRSEKWMREVVAAPLVGPQEKPRHTYVAAARIVRRQLPAVVDHAARVQCSTLRANLSTAQCGTRYELAERGTRVALYGMCRGCEVGRANFEQTRAETT